jgi:hypothetical protein
LFLLTTMPSGLKPGLIYLYLSQWTDPDSRGASTVDPFPLEVCQPIAALFSDRLFDCRLDDLSLALSVVRRVLVVVDGDFVQHVYSRAMGLVQSEDLSEFSRGIRIVKFLTAFLPFYSNIPPENVYYDLVEAVRRWLPDFQSNSATFLHLAELLTPYPTGSLDPFLKKSSLGAWGPTDFIIFRAATASLQYVEDSRPLGIAAANFLSEFCDLYSRDPDLLDMCSEFNLALFTGSERCPHVRDLSLLAIRTCSTIGFPRDIELPQYVEYLVTVSKLEESLVRDSVDIWPAMFEYDRDDTFADSRAAALAQFREIASEHADAVLEILSAFWGAASNEWEAEVVMRFVLEGALVCPSFVDAARLCIEQSTEFGFPANLMRLFMMAKLFVHDYVDELAFRVSQLIASLPPEFDNPPDTDSGVFGHEMVTLAAFIASQLIAIDAWPDIDSLVRIVDLRGVCLSSYTRRIEIELWRQRDVPEDILIAKIPERKQLTEGPEAEFETIAGLDEDALEGLREDIIELSEFLTLPGAELSNRVVETLVIFCRQVIPPFHEALDTDDIDKKDSVCSFFSSVFSYVMKCPDSMFGEFLKVFLSLEWAPVQFAAFARVFLGLFPESHSWRDFPDEFLAAILNTLMELISVECDALYDHERIAIVTLASRIMQCCNCDTDPQPLSALIEGTENDNLKRLLLCEVRMSCLLSGREGFQNEDDRREFLEKCVAGAVSVYHRTLIVALSEQWGVEFGEVIEMVRADNIHIDLANFEGIEGIELFHEVSAPENFAIQTG